MGVKERKYRAIVSSDWNECLAPTGPFDPLTFHFPELTSELSEIFKAYTANRIPFREAIGRVQALIPSPFTEDRMDAYLDGAFRTYPGVPEFMEWCLDKGILFMINTTGAQGFFQRVFAKGLLPRVPALSSSPFIRYPRGASDPPYLFDLFETRDKARHTEAIIRQEGIPAERTILMGDSGGDGPHFEWGRKVGAYLIGSMTKPSLKDYCGQRGIEIDLQFPLPLAGRGAGTEERSLNFMGLADILEEVLEGWTPAEG